MNSACIIAACAASARRQQESKNYSQYFTKDLELYYRVNFRMYVHFNSIKAIRPTEDVLIGSIYAPFKVTMIEPVTIEACSVAKQHSFSLRASKCPKGPDAYVKENLNKYTSSGIWQIAKKEIIDKYKQDIKDKYNIILDDSYLSYSIQYCWEIDCAK